MKIYFKVSVQDLISESDALVLVVYFSAQSHTKAVAEKIADNLDADIFELIPEDEYTEEDLDYNADNARVSREHDDLLSNLLNLPFLQVIHHFHLN